MESYLTITQINDFIFCPRSIFFSGIYHESSDKKTFHHTPQIVGGEHHKTIDEGTYSTRKDVITGLMVYSEKYNLLGKIDIYDMSTKLLTERKYSISAIYLEYRYQLYSQYFAMTEMGYEVQYLKLYSVKDNRSYSINLPNETEQRKYEDLLYKIRNYSLDTPFNPNPNKCKHCIYSTLCDQNIL